MASLQAYMDVYRKEMAKGDIPAAYRGLMDYLKRLRLHFQNKYPGHYVSGSLYPGAMDITFFAFISPALKARQLKTIVLFMHESCQFEIWLCGVNKRVQKKYWLAVKESGWDKYRVPASIKGRDLIIGHTLDSEPDFSDLDGLTDHLEKNILAFVSDVETFLGVDG